jgi:hypothetical protein
MKTLKFFLTGMGLFFLLLALCSQPEYSNPLDEHGDNYIGDANICANDDDGDGIANMYDKDGPAECHVKSTPKLTLLGANPLVIPLNDPNHETTTENLRKMVTVSDSIYTTLSAKDVQISTDIFTSKCSTFTVTYTVKNIAEVTTTAQRAVIVDCEGPVITLNGDNPMDVNVGKPYVEPGATAVDNVDGEIKTVTHSAAPNTATAHEDSVVYSAVDKIGNKSSSVKRIVRIVKPDDTTAPVITLIGSADTTITIGAGSFVDPGFIAMDDIDGNVHDLVKVSGGVNVGAVGNNPISYNVSDAAGNAAETKTRVVHVIREPTGPDVTPPEITLLGKNPDTVLVGQTWKEPGYTVWDDRDTHGLGKTVVVSGGPVITTVDKFFTLSYTVNDTAGNTSRAKVRIVIVAKASATKDTLKPEIKLEGNARCSVDVGTRFSDPGATAMDKYPTSTGTIATNNISTSITTAVYTAAWASASFDSYYKTIGQYFIVYNVADAAGNKADSVKRSVYVRDTTPPPPDTIFARYGVPTPGALPTINPGRFSDTVYTDGSPKIAPKVSGINEFTIAWDTANGGQVNQFSLSLKDGTFLSYQATGSRKLIQSFGSPGPKFTISGTGTLVPNLDGEYYIRITSTSCYWVRTDGKFAIIFKK